jgi:Leu/Phe-tRNA-protein transferase
MEKQTAVQWFYDQITRTYWDYMTTERQNELFEQAKAMEQEQIIEAYQSDRFPCSEQDAEQYYNETFNS